MIKSYVIILCLLNISNAVRPAHLHAIVGIFSYLFLTYLILTVKCLFCETVYLQKYAFFFTRPLIVGIQIKETLFSREYF